MLGEPGGALAGTNGSQSATESRTSSLMTPLNFLPLMDRPPPRRTLWGSIPGRSSSVAPVREGRKRKAGRAQGAPAPPVGESDVSTSSVNRFRPEWSPPATNALPEPGTGAPMSPHIWKFFRAGGFDQVKLETGADLMHLHELDLKLWVALACPTTGLEFDPVTAALVDTDKDGRIRASELIEAVRWAG